MRGVAGAQACVAGCEFGVSGVVSDPNCLHFLASAPDTPGC